MLWKTLSHLVGLIPFHCNAIAQSKRQLFRYPGEIFAKVIPLLIAVFPRPLPFDGYSYIYVRLSKRRLFAALGV